MVFTKPETPGIKLEMLLYVIRLFSYLMTDFKNQVKIHLNHKSQLLVVWYPCSIIKSAS